NDDGDLGNKDHSTGGGYAITLDEGEENLTADFGYNYNPTIEVNDPSDSGNMVAEVAAIGDRVWIDSDGDGVQDPNEVGVSGVEITLFTDSDGDGVYDDQVGTPITTDENGYYLFDDLPPGAYVTQVTDDAGASHDILDDTQYEQTGDPDHFGTSKDDNPDDSVEGDNRQTKPVVLGPGDVYLNSDYGYQPDDATPLGSIGNTIWLDADADGNGPSDSSIGVTGGSSNNGLGTDDSSEHPIEGVSVALIDDVNGDGIWDADGADNIPGTADDEKIIATDVTDEQGQYLFEDLPLDKNGSDSDYIVWVNDTENVLQDLRPTYDGDDSSLNTTAPEATGVGDDASEVLGMSDVTISSGNPDDRRQDFGYTPDEHDSGEGYIGDFVWFDTDRSGTSTPDMGEEGIEGVVLELLDVNGMVIQTTTTDEDGFYLFGNLPVDADGETYTVRVASSNFDPMGVLEGLEPTYEPDGDTDNSGDPITLFTDTGSGENGNLDQDFSYTGDDTNTLGSIGSTIWEDTDNDGIYEPFGTDNMDGTSDDETPLEGVTVNLIRDLNGNGQIDPGEPIIGTQTTDADGNYLFDQLPMGDYIVDVTDEDGILAGYFSSPVPSTDANTNTTGSGDTETADDKDAGSNGGGDQSKPDAFAVTLDDDPGTPDVVNNLNVDFGYYKEPAAVGNYVWLDNDGNGLQDDGETGLNGVEVTLDIEYPDGTMVTLVTITMNDADGNPGFYEFPNLLLDEDYNQGAGSNGADPTTVTPSGNTPKYVISVDPNQMILTDNGYVETTTDVNTNGNDLEDADPLSGVLAIPFQGSEDTSAKDPETNENPIASYDFGVRPPIYDLATTITISDNETDTQFTVGDPVLFDFTVTNQGADPVSDITITNYLPPALTPSADGTIGITSIVVRDENGMTRSVPVTVTKSGNDYVIDFGDTESDWLQPGDEISFDVEYTVNAGDATDNINDGIINIIEISSFDDDNDDSNTPPTDIDSTPDATDDNTFGENPRDNDNDNVVDEDGKTNPTTEDEDDHDFAEITAPNVLPVELLYFKAQADKDHVELTWSTASELNNSHFELERSEDGKTFKQIARIQGKGTTLEQTDYSYKDDKVIPNTLYYYRLKQMDFDGSFEYSEIRVVEINAITEWTLYPNPIGQDNLLNVSFYADQAVAEFFVLDAQNRSILQVKQDLSNTGWNQIQIDIAVLPSGTYILMDKEGNTKRFVVTNK
ncbi:MAG: SdrD B-like domain-containing protein, partial [Bacteroidota bacterium]